MLLIPKVSILSEQIMFPLQTLIKSEENGKKTGRKQKVEEKK